MTTDPRTTAELLADADREPADHEPADHGTSDRCDTIRGTADRGGVRVEVNVHGGLVGLRIAEQAMRQAPHQLVDQIVELVAEATRTATAEGLALLYWAGGTAVAAHLAAHLADEQITTDRATRTPEPAEPDTIEPTSWVVPPR